MAPTVAVGHSLVSRIWSSPSATTFASTALQALQPLVILPLVLWRFDAPTVALWALFLSIATVVSISAQSVTVTFVRAVAFAAAGARDIDELAAGKRVAAPTGPNLELLGELVAGARVTYAALALAVVVLLGTVATTLIDHLVAMLPDPSHGWIAWAIVVGATAVTTFGSLFVGYLEGHQQIAVVRRWDALFALLGAATSATVLVAGGDLLALVAATQSWLVIRVVRNFVLARSFAGGRLAALPRRPARAALRALWPATWRSFVGIASIYGVNYAGAIFYAQIGTPAAAASFLLAIRLIDTSSAVARAPFYSRIPQLVSDHARGETAAQMASAQRGMRGSYWLFTAALLGGAALGPFVFDAIGSDVPFPPLLLWFALGAAHLLERYGAMHLQLYSTTNRIVWHTATAGYAVLYLGALALLHRELGVYAFPVAMALGYAGWYSWYSARCSYRAFGLHFWSFERTVFLPPFMIAIAALLAAWITR